MSENKIKHKYELFFLEYHLKEYNAKYIEVFNNNNNLIPTKIVLYNGVKRKLKYQPISGEITLSKLFRELEENTFYSIPQLIKNEYKGE